MVIYIDFKGKCPARDCTNATTYQAWYHATCGAKTQIGDNACIKCLNGHEFHMKNWRFKCDQHDYRKADIAEFSHALSMALQQLGPAGNTWIQNVVINMGSASDWA